MSRTTAQPRLFDTISQAESAISRLRPEYKFLHRSLKVCVHPKRPRAFAIAIVAHLPAGDVLWGHIPEEATSYSRRR